VGQDKRYIYATGRIRVLESRLLNTQTLERLIEAQTPEEEAFILKERGLSADFAENLSNGYRVFDELNLDKDLKNIFRAKYDFHNLKVILAGLNETNFYTLGAFSIDIIKRMTRKERIKDIPFDYISLVENAGGSDLSSLSMEEAGLRQLNLTIDKAMVSYVLGSVVKNHFLMDYYKKYIDLKNLNFYFRFKKSRDVLKTALLDNGYLKKDIFLSELDRKETRRYESILERTFQHSKDEKDFDYFEKLADNYLLNLLKPAKHLAFGVEPLFSYVVAVEYQSRNIRAILLSKKNNGAKEHIRQNLRESYV
jgi:V/A-type H+/Na+-transporting ATPase subunit C